MPEAMKKIREDLGEDAVILNTKVITKKKMFGLIKQKSFEVVAGVDDIVQPVTPKAPIVPSTVSTVIQDDVSQSLKQEIDDLKKMMLTVQQQTKRQDTVPEQIQPFVSYLQRQELGEELITAIRDELFVHLEKEGTITVEQFEKISGTVIRQALAHLPMGGLTFAKKQVHVIGPTGVGKTTTIAKMAARAVLQEKKKIAFITTDTYRIAAIEQLKTYAGLLQAPVEIAYTAEDYANALTKLSHVDVVFVDTAGRNYKDGKYVEDLRDLIGFTKDAESFLVLTTTAKESDMAAVIDQFIDVPVEKFIFTKVDETNSIGTIINLMLKYNKGLAYYTDGQEVPEDIEEATIEKLLYLLFKGEPL